MQPTTQSNVPKTGYGCVIGVGVFVGMLVIAGASCQYCFKKLDAYDPAGVRSGAPAPSHAPAKKR